MKSISGKALCKALERHGWEMRRITGSHHICTKKGIKAILSVPVHGKRDVPIGTLRGILKDAGLSERDI